ncbi:MAG: methylenetetrahydrofolate reductase C-terminal domain-containing protein [Candidatus Rokubacteria bacterium]|nr:methylenetetrahydrofolate reductase C-terminal domain-containing protein [Candidatus Rokubacteria bacterium]
MEAPRHSNELRRRLSGGEWVVSIEFVTPEASEEFEGAIAPIVALGERSKGDPRIHTIALTDRVKSDDDHDPVRVARRVAEASGKAPTVHLSGKDRDPAWLADALGRMREAGLENLLLITGDKVKSPGSHGRVRYHDSVNMIAQARAASPAFHIAAAVSPFKYREEDLLNQYLKMVKKERAGAGCFITQVGWDMLKWKELLAYRRRRGLRAPVMAGLMLLTVARARFIRANRLAGITITDELQARLEADATLADKGLGAAYRRLALQIVGLKRLGYAGFQLTGMHQFEKVDGLLRQAEDLERQLPTESAWWEAWWEALRGPEGRPIATAPARPFYLFREHAEPGGASVALDRLTPRALDPDATPRAELRTFRALDGLDRAVFREGSPGNVVLGPISRLVPRGSVLDRGLHWLERQVKAPLVGCETCGFCRLPYTMYVCPETCPKGLANGPCGGTSENTCEFGDRECVHNRKYRVAKATGRLDELETVLIPVVGSTKRHTCSWTSHFRGEDPPVVNLLPIRPKGLQHDH